MGKARSMCCQKSPVGATKHRITCVVNQEIIKIADIKPPILIHYPSPPYFVEDGVSCVNKMKLNLHSINTSAIIMLLLGIAATPNLASKISQQPLPPPNCKDPQTNRDMIECGDRAFKEADKKLSQLYKTLQARMGEKQKKRLASSQQNWVKYRDTACAFEAGMYESGSLEPPTRISCYARMTTQRVRDLDTWLQELNRR
jgi:uncharacterized protein YecT (DUF1311 family)